MGGVLTPKILMPTPLEGLEGTEEGGRNHSLRLVCRLAHY